MLRLSLAAAAALSLATAANAQLANPTPYLEVGLGGMMPADSDDESALIQESIEFDNGLQGMAEFGMKTELSGAARGLGFIGVSYGNSPFQVQQDAISTTLQIRNDDEIDATFTSFYVGLGVEYPLSPKLSIGGNMKIGGSSVTLKSGDLSLYDTSTDPDTLLDDTGVFESEESTGLMWGPEAKLAYSITDQIDVVGTANAQFHAFESDGIIAESFTTYNVGGGFRFKLQ